MTKSNSQQQKLTPPAIQKQAKDSTLRPAVLIVEDSRAEEIRLKAMLEKLGYDVRVASNGQQALDILDRQHLQLIISDWRMPGITGIELCRQIRNDPKYGQPYFILLTGCDTQMDLVAGMDAGADDFITKPFNGEELRVRLQSGTRIVSLREDLRQHNTQLEQTLHNKEEANQRIKQDLNSAATMQQALLPSGDSPFPQLELATLFKPATVIAGDTYNYFRLDDKHLGFYHLDVAGHGIASAMLSFTLSRFLSPGTLEQGLLTQRSHDIASNNNVTSNANVTIARPHQVVASLNQRFLEDDHCEHYFTMVYGVLNVITGTGEFCQAGHPHPLLCRANGTLQPLGNGGFPVAMLAEANYESTPFKLEPGDRLWLYSDGIPDCNNETGKALGIEQFISLLQRTSKLTLARIPAGIDKVLRHWHGESPLDDDISLLAIGRKAQANEGRRANPHTLSLSILANADAVNHATERVGQYCCQQALPPDISFNIQVVVAEALNNIVEHAQLNQPQTQIELHCHHQNAMLVIETLDNGAPLADIPGVEMPNQYAESGRGWPIIYSWMDEVIHHRSENKNYLTLKKHLSTS